MRTPLRLSVVACLATHLPGCAVAHRVAPASNPPSASRDSSVIGPAMVVGFFIGVMLVWRAVEKD